MTLKRISLVVLAVFALLAPVALAHPIVVADKPTAKETANPYNAQHQLDLNSAPKSELVKLPGIGDAYADAIIKNRPYTNKTQIKTKAGVPAATYDKIADMIVAKQAK